MEEYKQIYDEYNNTDKTFDELYEIFISVLNEREPLQILKDAAIGHYEQVVYDAFDQFEFDVEDFKDLSLQHQLEFMFRCLCENIDE